jgi:hypothetical protein
MMTKEKQRHSLSIVCELINQVPAMSDADLLKEIQRRFPAVVGTGRESRETMILWLIKDELYNQFDPGFIPRKRMKRIIRDRLLTPEEVAKDELIREQIAKDFPPIKLDNSS